MPNGAHAVSTISVNEGRASRIADYNKGTNYENTPRGPRTLGASMARARSGMNARKAAARGGRMTHGASSKQFAHIPPGGMIKTNYKGHFVKGGPKRIKREKGTLTAHYKGHKNPTPHQIKKSVKNAGFYSVKPR